MADLWHPKEGRIRKLDVMTGKSDDPLVYALLLWQNDIVVDSDTEYLDLVEADFSGYEEIVLAGADFADAAASADDVVSLMDPKVFEHDGGGTDNLVYGWAIRSGGDAPALMYAKRYDAPISMSALGHTITVQERLREGQYPLD